MPSNSSNNQNPSSFSGTSSRAAGGGGGNGAKPKSAAEKSNYQMIKEGGWDNRVNFQYSYGLKMTPEDIEEGNRILDCFRQSDIEAEEAERKEHK